MKAEKNIKKLAIIGAGLAGINLGNSLKDHFKVKIFEKSRGLGGRMATRRSELFNFDHGAQYFRAKSISFKNFLKPLVNEGIIKPWISRHNIYKKSEIYKTIILDKADPYYVAVPAMNSITKYLAKDLDIEKDKRITRIKKKNNKWQLTVDNDTDIGPFEWLVITAPAPQSAELLPKSLKIYKEINNIEMHSCYSLMLGTTNIFDLGFDSAKVFNQNIEWISVNSSKPGRSKNTCLTIITKPSFARGNIDKTKELIIKKIVKETSSIIAFDLSIFEHKVLQFWRYGMALKKRNGLPFFLDKKNKIALCGDWCINNKVEGAFMSSNYLSKEIIKFIE